MSGMEGRIQTNKLTFLTLSSQHKSDLGIEKGEGLFQALFMQTLKDDAADLLAEGGASKKKGMLLKAKAQGREVLQQKLANDGEKIEGDTAVLLQDDAVPLKLAEVPLAKRDGAEEADDRLFLRKTGDKHMLLLSERKRNGVSMTVVGQEEKGSGAEAKVNNPQLLASSDTVGAQSLRTPSDILAETDKNGDKTAVNVMQAKAPSTPVRTGEVALMRSLAEERRTVTREAGSETGMTEAESEESMSLAGSRPTSRMVAEGKAVLPQQPFAMEVRPDRSMNMQDADADMDEAVQEVSVGRNPSEKKPSIRVARMDNKLSGKDLVAAQQSLQNEQKTLPEAVGGDKSFSSTLAAAHSPSAVGDRVVARHMLPSSSQPVTLPKIQQEVFMAVQEGRQYLEIRLHPKELGKIDIRIDADPSKKVHIHAVFDNPMARQAFEQQSPQLRQSMLDQGFSLGEFDLSDKGERFQGGQQQGGEEIGLSGTGTTARGAGEGNAEQQLYPSGEASGLSIRV